MKRAVITRHFGRGFSTDVRENLYRIGVISGKGRVALALHNIDEGTEICRERPLLSVVCESAYSSSVNSHSKATKIQPDLVALLWQFNSLPKIEQDQILDFHCPTEGSQANLINKVADTWQDVTILTKNLVVKIATIMNFNSYVSENGNRALHYLTSLMSHSCAPNCVVDTASVEMTVRCITPIKKGEELTIAYNEEYFDKPTHVRRRHLSLSKEFLCQCSRCARMGDDTRQFNCFDLTCPGGRHLVMQPSSEAAPSLTACSVCRRFPPAAYQHQKLLEESNFPSKTALLSRRMAWALALPVPGSPEEMRTGQEKEEERQRREVFREYHVFEYFSSCHSQCAEFALEQAAFYQGMGADPPRALRLTERALECLDSCVSFPHFYVAVTCSRLAELHMSVAVVEGEQGEGERALVALWKARGLYERALRICEIEQRKQCRDMQTELEQNLRILIESIEELQD